VDTSAEKLSKCEMAKDGTAAYAEKQLPRSRRRLTFETRRRSDANGHCSVSGGWLACCSLLPPRSAEHRHTYRQTYRQTDRHTHARGTCSNDAAAARRMHAAAANDVTASTCEFSILLPSSISLQRAVCGPSHAALPLASPAE